MSDAVDQPPPVGTVLEDRYKLLGDLGSGGVGWVYVAEHLKLGHQVAIKMLQADFLHHEQMRPRFEREAKALAALSHPNIVTITDYSVAHGYPYLVMELLQGQTLASLIEQGPIADKRAIAITRQILDALIYAHQRGFVHRDLKPGNVFLVDLPTQRDFVKILDFGFVKLVGEEAAQQMTLTRSGFAFGTPSYMSPEQASGSPVDARTDLYSLGILLFEMLTGARPFRGEIPEIIRQHLTAEVPEAGTEHRVASRELQAFLTKATAKHAENRFASAAEMLASLELLPDALMIPRPPADPHAATMEIEISSPPISTTSTTSAGRPRSGEKATKLERKSPAPKSGPKTAKRKKNGASVLWVLGAILALLVAIGAVASLYSDRIVASLGTGGTERTGDPGVTERTGEGEPGEEGPIDEAALADEVAQSQNEAPAPEPTSEPSLGPNPWTTRERVALLSTARQQVLRGRNLSRNTEQAIKRWARANRGDPRPHLVLGAYYSARDFQEASLERYDLAQRVAPDAKGDPRMLHDLVRLSAEGPVTRQAADAVARIYGATAVPAIDGALERAGLSPEAQSRLRSLRARVSR